MRRTIRILCWVAGILFLTVLAIAASDWYVAEKVLSGLSRPECRVARQRLAQLANITTETLAMPSVPARVEARLKELRTLQDTSKVSLPRNASSLVTVAAAWNKAPRSTTTTRVREIAADLAQDREYDYGCARLEDNSAVLISAANDVLAAASQEALRLGRSGEAISLALDGLRLARRSMGAPVINHLLADLMIRRSSTVLGRAAPASTSPVELRAALAEMHRLNPMVNHEILSRCELLDKIWLIRTIRKDEAVDFQNVHTNRDLLALLTFDKKTERRLRWMPASREALLVFLAAVIPVPSRQEAVAREHWAAAAFHLAQFALAQRLDELTSSTGKPSSIAGELRTRLRDPYTSETYALNRETGCFYSVGPDRRDDRMMSLFDPTNGVASAGDYWIDRRP